MVAMGFCALPKLIGKVYCDFMKAFGILVRHGSAPAILCLVDDFLFVVLISVSVDDSFKLF